MLLSHWLKYASALKKKGCDSEGITNCSSLLTQVIPDESDSAYIFDERFHLFSQLFPTKLQIVSSVNKSDATPEIVKGVGHVPKAVIYDIVYLSKRDLYAYTASDHSITVCKEVSTMGGKKINYLQFNRFFHTLLHLRLCWSPKHDTLCSAASDYGTH